VVQFYAFDIRTDHGYVNYDKCIEIFQKLDLFHAKILTRGTLEDVIKFEVEGFQTTIPGLLGLPDIEDNIAEGVVIKPVNAHYISGDRVIIKKKTKAFSEVNVESIMKLKKEQKKNVEIKKISDEVIELSNILVCYVTINRVKNLISKIGEVKVDEVNSLIGLLAKDAFTDFKIDYESRYEKLKEEEKKSLSKKLANASKDLISTNASKIVKNEI
jgi:Rnl2 family RNA ligase